MDIKLTVHVKLPVPQSFIRSLYLTSDFVSLACFWRSRSCAKKSILSQLYLQGNEVVLVSAGRFCFPVPTRFLCFPSPLFSPVSGSISVVPNISKQTDVLCAARNKRTAGLLSNSGVWRGERAKKISVVCVFVRTVTASASTDQTARWTRNSEWWF